MSSSSASRTARLIWAASAEMPARAHAPMKSSRASRKWILESHRVSSASKIRLSGARAFGVIAQSVSPPNGGGNPHRFRAMLSQGGVVRGKDRNFAGYRVRSDVDLGFIDAAQVPFGENFGWCAASH